MKQMSSRAVRAVLKSIDETYKFMLERGYEVISVEDYDLGWQAVLRRQNIFAKIIRSRGEEEIYFRAGTQPPDEFTDIGSVIFAATGDKIPRWESSNPEMIDRYLDRIETYFEGEYVRNKDSLRAAGEEYHAAFSRGDAVFPPEPEITPASEPRVIPILYYPLMGMILLLLFGALTTLYMVLLDGLFSAFSLDSDSYDIFRGVVALLLAIGTMLSIWWRRKKG